MSALIKVNKNIIFKVFSLIYGAVTEIRNSFFDLGILKTKSFDLPIISIGNLAVGGTGKTPHTEFLIQQVSKNFKIAVLSRGYKRETRGFVLADKNSTAKTIGDEPYQLFGKFPAITVAVDEKRVRGVEQLLKQKPDTELILLDDAFQHRYIKPGLSVLLTDFSKLYTDDFMLPYGSLREYPKNSYRADIIIVTKCPENMKAEDCKDITNKLKPAKHQSLFFSAFNYGKIYPVYPDIISKPAMEINNATSVLLLTGIENPQPMLEWVQKKTSRVTTKFFPDHHDFSVNDITDIEKDFAVLKEGKFILTTEKDAARLKSNPYLTATIKENLYALPLEVKILNNEQDTFIKKIQDYVSKNSGNR